MKPRWMPDVTLAHLPGPKQWDPLARIHDRFPAGPERLREVVKQVEKDAAPLLGLPFIPEQAARGFRKAIEDARAALGSLDTAREETAQARQADVDAATRALKSGKAAPQKLAMSAAREREEQALIGLEAHEQLVLDAHLVLTDTARDSWPEWRRSLVQEAQEADRECRQTAERLSQLLEDRVEKAGRVLVLDQQIVGRYRDVRTEVGAERRHGLEWFKAAVAEHFGWATSEPGRFKQTIAKQMTAIMEYLGRGMPWLREWSPPGDDEHDHLQETPLDLSAGWVRAYLLPDDRCPDCGQRLPADVEIDLATLKPVHECKAAQTPSMRRW